MVESRRRPFHARQLVGVIVAMSIILKMSHPTPPIRLRLR